MNTEQKKLKVLFMDAYCSSHVGNDVLLESSMKLADKAFSNPEYIVHAKSADAFVETLGIDCSRRLFPNAPPQFWGKAFWLLTECAFMAVQLLNMTIFKLPPHWFAFGQRRKSVLDYECCDIAISISGEMLNDSFRKTLLMYLFMFWFAKKCGNKTIIFPQSIGPLHRSWTRWLTSRVLPDLDAVSPRDEHSRKELVSLGLSNNLIIPSPDVGLDQPCSKEEETINYLHEQGIVIDDSQICIGLTVSAWTEEGVSKGNYLDCIVSALQAMRGELSFTVLIMPANMPVKGNGSQDYDTSIKLHKRIGLFCQSVVLPPAVLSARLFKAITGKLDVFVSTRMHASILASMTSTPTITINTQRKLAGYMKRINQESLAIDIDDLNSITLAETIKTTLNNREHIRRELNKARDEQISLLDAVAVKLSSIAKV